MVATGLMLIATMTDRGPRIKKLMRQRGVQIKDLMDAADMSRPTVSRYVRGLRSPGHRFRKVFAELNRIPLDAADELFGPAEEEEAMQVPTGLRPGTDRPLTDREHFHSVAAAKIDRREPVTRGSVKVPAGGAREFAITCDGDCMEPKYYDGEVVLFSVDAVERNNGVINGRSYFLQFEDGESTFKRVFYDPDSFEHFILKPWNDKYPSRTVSRSSVKIIALATGKIAHPE